MKDREIKDGEEGMKAQEAGSEKKAENKWKRSPEDERGLWDNKKLRGYKWNQKAKLEERRKENQKVNGGLEKEATKIRIEIKVEVAGTECLQAQKKIKGSKS